MRDFGWTLPLGLFLLWIWFLVTAITNGVNLTDGLDGLAAGASVLTFGGFTLIGVWQYGQNCSAIVFDGCYTVRDPLDLAAFSVACAGACFGFLWWNTSPAQIFMGDTGSLALGGAMAALAIKTPAPMWLPAEALAPEPEQHSRTLAPMTASTPPSPPHHSPGTRKPRHEMTPKTSTAMATPFTLFTSGRLFGSLLHLHEGHHRETAAV